MTTPHTPPAALDVAAIEARAAAATCPRCHGRGTVYDSTPAGYLLERQCVACLGAGRPSSDVLALLAALRTLAAQHAADVAAAVAGERERAVAVCRAVADGWERASTTAKVDTGLALIRAEGATECADALACDACRREAERAERAESRIDGFLDRIAMANAEAHRGTAELAAIGVLIEGGGSAEEILAKLRARLNTQTTGDVEGV